jgi:hypothetical protein
MKITILVLAMFSLVSLANNSRAESICGQVASITKTTLPAAAPDYDSMDQGENPTPAPTAVTQVKLLLAQGNMQTVNVSSDLQSASNILFLTAFIAKSQVCYDSVTGDVSISR